MLRRDLWSPSGAGSRAALTAALLHNRLLFHCWKQQTKAHPWRASLRDAGKHFVAVQHNVITPRAAETIDIRHKGAAFWQPNHTANRNNVQR